MSEHETRHRPFLEELFCGTRGAEDDEIAELIRTCSECAREVDEMRRLTEELDQLGVAERIDVAQSEPIQPADADLARRTFGLLIEETRRTRRRRWIAAAAAIGLGAVVWWIGDRSRRWDAAEDYLGGETEGDAAPVGLVEQWGEFRWPGEELKSGTGEYRLFLQGIRFDAQKGVWMPTDFLLPVRRLTSPRWDSSSRANTEFPDAVEWTVRQFDASGREIRSDLKRRAWRPSGAPRGS